MNFNGPGNVAETGASFAWLQQLQRAMSGDHPALRKGNLPLELAIGELPAYRVAVVSVTGHEEVNATYQYDVEVVTPFPPEVFQPAVFGMDASLLMRTPEHDARVIQGIVGMLEIGGIAERGLGKNLFRYVVTLVPRLWTWTQRRRNRVFQHQTVLEVATSMLKADKIAFELKLDDTRYPKRALYYQRDETDYDFFKRILADSGVFFLFEHAVQDSRTRGVVSAVGTGAGAVAAAGGALSAFGASAVGGAMGSMGQKVQGLTHAITRLVFGDEAGAATPLQDYAALNDLSNVAAQQGIKAAERIMDKLTMFAGAVPMNLAAGFDAADVLEMDDGSHASLGDERVYALSYRRSVRPKSVWSLERDSREPKNWGHRERQKAEDTPEVKLDLHLSLGRKGICVDGGPSIKLTAADAPMIPAEKLEQEIVARNAGWLAYPSETHNHRSEGHFVDTHKHLKRSLEQLRRDAAVVQIETDCRRLAAGYRFRVAKHPSQAMNAEYTVTGLTVSGLDPDMVGLDTKDPRRERPYLAKLVCVPSEDGVLRPPLPEKKKLGMELGTVVRWKESADMVSFDRGEVLVRLGWDTDKDGAERPFPVSSRDEDIERVLKIPVLQPWAGNGYGMQVTPREGMQVVIGYLDDQGDRPVILGCLHSNGAPPPWSGFEAVKVGFRTQSRWPRATYEDRAVGRTTGWSEISIDDTGSHERVFVRAEKVLDVEVGEARTETVGTDASLSVGGSRAESVGGSRAESVGGSATEEIAGGLVRRVGLDTFDSTVGTYTQSVGRDEDRSVAGDATLSVSGTRSVTIGTPDAETNDNQRVYGDYNLIGSGNVNMRVEKGLTITCGDSVFRMTPDGVHIEAKNLTFGGLKTVTLESGDGPILLLDKQATLVAKKIALTADKASVELGSDAVITGTSIALKKPGSGSSKSSSATDDDKDKDIKTLKVKLLDGMRKPIANKRYHLFYGDTRSDGTTDGDGVLEAKLPKALTRCEVIVWLEEYPKGMRSHYVFHLGKLPDLGTPDGVRARLHALGYDVGLGHTNVDEALAEAVEHFQRDHAGDSALKITGTVDDVTRAAIDKVFGGQGAEAASSAGSQDDTSGDPDGAGDSSSSASSSQAGSSSTATGVAGSDTRAKKESDDAERLETMFGADTGSSLPNHPHVRHVLLDDPASPTSTTTPNTPQSNSGGQGGPGGSSGSAAPATAVGLERGALELPLKSQTFSPNDLDSALLRVAADFSRDLRSCMIGQAFVEQRSKGVKDQVSAPCYNYVGLEAGSPWDPRIHPPKGVYTWCWISVYCTVAEYRKQHAQEIDIHPTCPENPPYKGPLYTDWKDNNGFHSAERQIAAIEAKQSSTSGQPIFKVNGIPQVVCFRYGWRPAFATLDDGARAHKQWIERRLKALRDADAKKHPTWAKLAEGMKTGDPDSYGQALELKALGAFNGGDGYDSAAASAARKILAKYAGRP